MVKEAVQRLNKNKKDELNFLYTDALIYGPDKLYSVLSELFTVMLRHGFTSDIFNLVVFSPLIKDRRKNINSSDNYRAIALNSCFSKLFDYVILNFLNDLFSTSDYQFAFKKDYSTTMCSFMVTETIQYYKNKGSNVIASLLDFSKAFDRVKYDKLFSILFSKNLCPLVLRMLIVFYSNVEAYVKWKGYKSSRFKINNGVKQGGVISPCLFIIYIDYLITRINNTGVGCYIGNKCSSIFVYADDVILLAPTKSSMSRLLTVCEEFETEFGLKFNVDKCEVINLGTNFNDVKFKLNGHFFGK